MIKHNSGRIDFVDWFNTTLIIHLRYWPLIMGLFNAHRKLWYVDYIGSLNFETELETNYFQ